MTKRFHIVPFLLLLLGFGLFQQAGDPSQGYTDSLGFSLMPGANSSPVTFHIVRKYDDPAKEISVSNISQGSFLSIATGWGESTANPNKENLFDKYDVANCGYRGDTIIRHVLYKGGLICNPLNDLWRLSYNEWPFYTAPVKVDPQKPSVNNPIGPGPGWAKEKSNPSPGQQDILKKYGTTFYNDIIYGANAFYLLHDMQDNDWVSRYKSS